VRPLAWLLARAPDEGEAARAAEIESELEHHLACARAELERDGLTPAAAATEAERRFGARTRIEAECLAIHLRIPMLSRVHLIVTAALLLSTLTLAFFLQRARVTATQAQASAMEALARAEEARARSVRVSRVHEVWGASAGASSDESMAQEATESSAALEQRLRELMQRIEELEELDPARLTPEEQALLEALGYSSAATEPTSRESEDSRAALKAKIREYLERRPSSELFWFDGGVKTNIQGGEEIDMLDEQALQGLEDMIDRSAAPGSAPR